jgi:hypothetical protein
MIPFNNSSSNYADLSNCYDPYLEPAPSSYLRLDSNRSQSEMSSFVAGSDSNMFDDFIVWESAEPNFHTDYTSILHTSGSAWMDLSRDISTTPLFTSLPGSAPVTTDAGLFPSSTNLGHVTYSLGSNILDSAVGEGIVPYLTEPTLNQCDDNHCESIPGENSERDSQGDSIIAHRDDTLAVPQKPFFKCRTCKREYSCELRLRCVV